MFPKCNFELHTQSSSTSAALFRIFERTGNWKSRLKELWGTEITRHLVPLQLESNYKNENWIVRGFFSIYRSTGLSREYLQIIFLNHKPCYLDLRKQVSNILIKMSEETLQVATKSDRMQPGEPPFYIHLYIRRERICNYIPEYIEAQLLHILQEAFHTSLLENKSFFHTRLDAEECTSGLRPTRDHQTYENFQLLPKMLYSPTLQNTKVSSCSTTVYPTKTSSEIMKNLREFISSPSVYTPIGEGALKLTESISRNQISTSIHKAIFNKLQLKGIWNRSFLLFWAENTLYAMDQHAADERVQYENLQYKLLELVKSGSITTKTLNDSPVYLQLNMEEYEYACRYKDILYQWGWRLALDSNSLYEKVLQVQVMEMPHLPDILTSHADILRQQIQTIVTTKSPDVVLRQIPEGVLEELATRACQKAIKFGESLTLQKVNQLLEQLKECNYPFQCAHGRPSIVPILKVSK